MQIHVLYAILLYALKHANVNSVFICHDTKFLLWFDSLVFLYRIMGALRVDLKGTYINIRLVPSEDSRPLYKARSRKVHKDNAIIDDNFSIPTITQGRAVQIRVQRKARLRLDTVLGEVCTNLIVSCNTIST